MAAVKEALPATYDLFPGGGEMGARIRGFDWSSTALGEPAQWPQSLKAVVRVMLTSRFAMWMAWGPELTFFCNDAYLPTTGIKRDWVLGARSDTVWAEIWPDIGPRIMHVLSTGEATWDEALLLYLERAGYPEESYHTFSYSPLADDCGQTAGMFCVVAEVTEKVIGERQLGTLRDLGARLAASSTRGEVVAGLEACLASETRDLPFALAYLYTDANGGVDLAARHRIDAAAPGAAPRFELAGAGTPWPFAQVLAARTPKLVEFSPGLIGQIPTDHWQIAPTHALVLPIAGPESGVPLGFIVAGLNPHRVLDERYRGFLELLTGQVAAAIARTDEYERERERATALAEIDRAKTAFFANVSHEFRTPLTLMLGPLEEALADPAVSRKERDRVAIAHRNGLRLLRLVNGLLDFSRLEAGRVEANYRPADLAAITAELASIFRSACERAGLTLTVDCRKLSAPVYVDRDMWEKIVLNLLSNAFKFTLEGGIRVSVREVPGRAVVEVADTGTGIPAAELPRLFERFHRVEGARGRSYEGSGIGLALVHDLVGLHGGTVSAHSEPGRGTTFRVELPLGRDHLPADRIETASGPSPAATRAQAFVDEAMRWLPDADAGRPAIDAEFIGDAGAAAPTPAGRAAGAVLLADDNADLRDYVGRLLRSRGYVVTAVGDGQAALEAARAVRPDLVLSDVMMPGLDGFGLLAAIRADADLRDVPVVLLSARAGEEAQVDGLQAGADDYLAKPFSARELLARVAANLDMARARREAADAVRASEARLRVERAFLAEVLGKAPIGISITDADGRITMLNERGVELLGHRYEAGRADDFGLYGGVHADGRAYEPADYPTIRAARGERVNGERLIYVRGGPGGTERVVLEVDAAPVADASGQIAGVVTVFDDAGKRERAELELQRRVAEAAAELALAQDALRQSQKLEAMGQLTGGVAHDFNNLLTPIVGGLDLIRRRGIADQRTGRIVDGALAAAERARVLVQRLLAFARRQPLQPTAVDVSAVVGGMADLLASTLGPRIALTIEGESRVSPALADANQLEMAVLNLAVNARDAMPDGGRLLVTIDEAPAPASLNLAGGGFVRLSVRDTGFGMDEATLRRAVEPFFSTKGVGQGTGLGLSMVHGLASQLGGALDITSARGEGTTVTLFLPVAEGGLAAPGDRVAMTAKVVPGSVLLVDDEDLVRAGTAEMLMDLGYVVTEARSAGAALELLQSGQRFDLLVTDHLMPGMTGVELASEARERAPDVQVLLISGYADIEGVASGVRRLTKPFLMDDLSEAIISVTQGQAG